MIPRATIIIPCRNEIGHIDNFLSSLINLNFPEEGVEIIIADGMSNDGTREIIKTWSNKYKLIRVIDNPGKIVSIGLNLAIKEASSDIIIRMDVHSEYDKDYITKCIAMLLKTNCENVGGPARTKAKSYFQKANSLAFHSAFSVGGSKFHRDDYVGYVDTVTYGCWFKKTLINIGLFDEELERNQDDELNLRICRTGGKIWQSPEIISWYYPRSSISSLFKQYMQYGYWKVKVIIKHRIPASIRHIVPGGFVGVLLLLSLLSIFYSWPRYTFAILFNLYLFINLSSTLICCWHLGNWKYIPVMPFVFAAYHYGYGLGFLMGVIDFMLLKRGGRAVYGKITRK